MNSISNCGCNAYGKTDPCKNMSDKPEIVAQKEKLDEILAAVNSNTMFDVLSLLNVSNPKSLQKKDIVDLIIKSFSQEEISELYEEWVWTPDEE